MHVACSALTRPRDLQGTALRRYWPAGPRRQRIRYKGHRRCWPATPLVLLKSVCHKFFLSRWGGCVRLTERG